MPEHLHDDAANAGLRRETSDINVRALVWFVVVFVAVAVVSHAGIWLMYRFFRDAARDQTTTPLTAIARPAGLETPPSPRLQPYPMTDLRGEVTPPYRMTPVMDLDDMRKAEDDALHNAGWIDQQKGIVRLPIDLAKQLVIQQGLPVVESKR